MIAGIALGSRLPEQWGVKRAPADFYDLKADVSSLLALSGARRRRPVRTRRLPRLACIRAEARRSCAMGRVIGQLGELHPALLRELDFTYAPLLFELDYHGGDAQRTGAFHAGFELPADPPRHFLYGGRRRDFWTHRGTC